MIAAARPELEGAQPPNSLPGQRLPLARIERPTCRPAHLVAIAVWGVLVHGLTLFNLQPFWDGWLIHSRIKEHDYKLLYSVFASSGVPTAFLVHWALGHLGGVFAYRATAILAQVIAAMLVYAINIDGEYFTREEGLLLALLTLAYPAVKVSFELIIVPYWVAYAMFLCGVWMALRAESAGAPSRRWLRPLALAAFFYSFGINSLLVFYLGFLFLLFLRFAERCGTTPRQSVVSFAGRRLDYVVLPILFWGLKQAAFPHSGAFRDYATFKFSPRVLVGCFVEHLWFSVYRPITDAIPRAVASPVAAAILVLILIRLCNTSTEASSRVSSRQAAVFGLALLGLGTIPYALVGVHATLTGWTTRNGLLMALPTCILLLAFARAMGPPHVRMTSTAVAVLAFTASGFAAIMVDNYLGYQARAAKDQAIMAYLSAHPDAGRYSIFWVDDQIPVGGFDTYRPHEWASMFTEVWHADSHVGLDLAAVPYTRTGGWFRDETFERQHYYNLGAFNPDGLAARLVIRKGPRWTEAAEVGVRHIYYTVLAREHLQDWMAGLVEIDIRSDSPGPSDYMPQQSPETP